MVILCGKMGKGKEKVADYREVEKKGNDFPYFPIERMTSTEVETNM